MKSTSMKIKNVLAIAALATPFLGMAQDNLIDNGGFESTSGKVKKLNGIGAGGATGWKSPTGVGADLFMSDSKVPDIGAPKNIYGEEGPKEGENYAGIVAFSYQNKIPRSYLTTKLTTPLKEGQLVFVTFYVNLAEGSKYSCNQIGMNFSKKEFATDQKTSIIDKAQILHPKNKVFNSYLGWEKVCGTYRAQGGEKFITIGNFNSNEDTKQETQKKTKENKFANFIGAYYYIDDISVQIMDDIKKCDCQYEDAQQNQTSTLIYQKQLPNNMDKMTSKEKIEVQSVNFAFGMNDLTPQGKAALDLIATELKANPTMNVTLMGHTDPNEEELATKKPYYENMDQKRIDAVMAYLKEKGVAEGRMKMVPKGSAEPLGAEGDDDELKQAKSRRVEVKVN